MDQKKFSIECTNLFNIQNNLFVTIKNLVKITKDSVKSNKTLDNCMSMHLFDWFNEISVALSKLFLNVYDIHWNKNLDYYINPSEIKWELVKSTKKLV